VTSLIAATAIALQFRIVKTAVAPEALPGAPWQCSSAEPSGYEGDLAADRLLLLVHGSRSDIALARSLLALR